MQPKLTLYVKTGCPYCTRILGALKELSLPFTEKNRGDDLIAAELIKRGGKRQVPYLVDETTGIEMYESEDIVEYLMKNYGGRTQLAVNKSTEGNVCIPKDFLS